MALAVGLAAGVGFSTNVVAAEEITKESINTNKDVSVKKISDGAIVSPDANAHHPGPVGTVDWHTDRVIRSSISRDHNGVTFTTTLLLGIARMPIPAAIDLANSATQLGYKNLWYTKFKQRGIDRSTGAEYTRDLTYWYKDNLRTKLIDVTKSEPRRYMY